MRLADIKGRKPMLIIALFCTVLFTSVLLVTNSLIIAYIIIFLNGVVIAVRVSVSYVMMMELVPENKKKRYNLISAICDSTGVIIIALYYYFVKYGESLFYVYIILTCVFLFLLWKVPETPHFLYSHRRWTELHEAFDKIAELNNGNKLGVKFDAESNENGEHVEPDKSFTALVSDKARLINLLAMIFNWSVCSFSFYVIGFFIKYFKGNVYTNAAMMGCADI